MQSAICSRTICRGHFVQASSRATGLAFVKSAALLMCTLLFSASLGAQTYDVAAAFEQGWVNKSNPNGVWSYGYSSGFSAPVTLYTQTVQNGVNGPNAQYWPRHRSISARHHQPSSTTVRH